MKKVLALFIFTSYLVSSAYSQTMHSLIFVNKKEVGREVDRTAEMNNMKDFCMEIANALGYYHNLRTHSDNEFTSKVLDVIGMMMIGLTCVFWIGNIGNLPRIQSLKRKLEMRN